MKAISIWQPWATLIAIGAKRMETRSWSTTYRGPLAIHASKKWTPELARLATEHPFRQHLIGHDLPRGAIVAVAELVAVYQVGHGFIWSDGTPKVCMPMPEVRELLFGDFSPGRYAWVLDKVRMLSKPILASGAQGLFGLLGLPAAGCGDRHGQLLGHGQEDTGMSRRKDEYLTCCYVRCRRPIQGEQLAARVATAAGPMHAECFKKHWNEVEAITQRAIAEGRHRVDPVLPTGTTKEQAI